MKLLQEAGLPDGVINFLPGSGGQVGDPVLGHPDLAGIHFTGSTAVFQAMWRTIGENIARYRSYPRIVGETGGKDFVFAHPSARRRGAASTALVRGAFEYQGQKCSAASRAYVPRSLWPRGATSACATQIEADRNGHAARLPQLHGRGDRRQGASTTSRATSTTRKHSADAEILAGGKGDDTQGLLHRADRGASPTDPHFKLMRGGDLRPGADASTSTTTPSWTSALELCDTTSPYALTGAVFARDRGAIDAPGRSACATPPATSTSTTSPPAPWSASSPSAAPAPRAPTTRRARR